MARHFVNLKVQSEKIARRRFFDQEIGLRRLDLQGETEVPEEISGPRSSARCRDDSRPGNGSAA